MPVNAVRSDLPPMRLSPGSLLVGRLASKYVNIGAREILERSQKAYDSVKTLEEFCQGSVGTYTGRAHIFFERPDKLAVSGNYYAGRPYEFFSKGGITSVNATGVWTTARDAVSGIQLVRLPSAESATAVPLALLHARAGNVLLLSGATKVEAAKVGTRKAWKLSGTKPRRMTLWIDAGTYFLLKTQSEESGKLTVVNYDPPMINHPIRIAEFRP